MNQHRQTIGRRRRADSAAGKLNQRLRGGQAVSIVGAGHEPNRRQIGPMGQREFHGLRDRALPRSPPAMRGQKWGSAANSTPKAVLSR